ncbi:receptor-activated Ca2+-permeable cation channel [Crassisporium funariophilum]|nr:receptor-activated Ca2+-permeable cation channel [Crassisporium funariophilum]
MSESQPERQPLLRPQDIDATPVYPIIHMIRSDVTHYIDTPLSYEALISPDLTYTLVRPLVEKYLAIQQDGNLSVVFCFLINRVHFIRDDNMTTATLSKSRAHFCEILATRVFRDNANSILLLTMALTTSWPVYSGADPAVISQAREERDDDLEDRVGNAIEMAILGKAKRFIKSSACQKVIDGIWTGKCVYQAESSHSILSDTYKRTPIHFYDPHKAPLLDHYRLKVPSIRSVLEYLNFLTLFVLFIVAIELNQHDRLNAAEIAFMVYALGFTLEKVAAMQEHGIKVYFKGTWNGFDLVFITVYAIYVTLRLYGVYHGKAWACTLGIDVLALIACLMFPRLAFVTFKDNLLVLSLRAMIMQFMFLMIIAAFCFCGFLYALWTLSRDDARYGPGLIAWWMLDLWFGLDASGFDRATTFHPVFGPVLMVTYACLSNTLLLTVLVSILSNTFAAVNEDAAAEAMFRKAVSTIEGVKADSLFSYQPPVNLVALCIMLPASYVLSPRWFHKVNVFMIRLTSFPILLMISLYERQAKLAGAITFYDTIAHVAEKVFDTLPRSMKRMTFFEGLAGADADIDAVFEIEDDFDSALDNGDNNDGFSIQNQRRLSGGSSRRGRQVHPSSPPKAVPRARITSIMNRGFETQTFSPLAQVFNPVVVEEDIMEEPNSGSSAPQGISYGPASRRRLMSMQSQRRAPPEPFGVQPMKRFPALSDKGTPPEQGILRSRSQDRYPMQGRPGPGEIKSMDDNNNDDPERSIFMSRLDDIERRQKRMESLLTQISESISSLQS